MSLGDGRSPGTTTAESPRGRGATCRRGGCRTSRGRAPAPPSSTGCTPVAGSCHGHRPGHGVTTTWFGGALRLVARGWRRARRVVGASGQHFFCLISRSRPTSRDRRGMAARRKGRGGRSAPCAGMTRGTRRHFCRRRQLAHCPELRVGMAASRMAQPPVCGGRIPGVRVAALGRSLERICRALSLPPSRSSGRHRVSFGRPAPPTHKHV